jgi:hypothetical protein
LRLEVKSQGPNLGLRCQVDEVKVRVMARVRVEGRARVITYRDVEIKSA